MTAPGDPDAVTFGNKIFCKKECKDIIKHELVHVEQYRADNLLPVKYLIEALRNGTCTNNRYEAPAYAQDGTCTP